MPAYLSPRVITSFGLPRLSTNLIARLPVALCLPIFTQVLLADEINRATPKTQSALLEAMEERQVTMEGKTRPIEWPFFVIATQNPIEQSGTFPLPESQLDRFLMRIDLGYPHRDHPYF